MKQQTSLIKATAGFMLDWGVTYLALEGAIALFGRFFAFIQGGPKLPMVLSVACAIALGLQVVRRRPYNHGPQPAAPVKAEAKNKPAPSPPTESHPFAGTEALQSARPEGPPLTEVISRSIDLQLELIRQAFDLTSVALLWPAPDAKHLELCNIATVHRHIKQGPFPIGAGITGALSKETSEIAIAPVRGEFSGLPYYGDQDQAGSLFLARLPQDPLQETACASDRPGGILCVDRTSTEPWSDAERQALSLAARRLALDISIGERLYQTDQESRVIRQICMGMHELNQGLGLEASFDATNKAVRALVPADFIAISLVEDDRYHTTHWAEGTHADKILGAKHLLNEGLVGQVIKFNRPLPEGGEYQGASPVFSSRHLFSDFRSLLILPLRKDGEAPIGVLTVASKKPGLFRRSQQGILQLIATQVAIKIDLAQSHERINQMAITDSLTGLANHRAFLHGFEVMLNRAQRRESPLVVLLCDVDHFKGVNDRYGHPFGDQVLKKVAQTLGNSVRVVDLAARYGGEEFVAVLEDSSHEGARFMAERLRSQVEGLSIPFQGKEVKVTISIGYALYPENGLEMQALIDRADEALYQAKKNGRNRVEQWGGPQVKTA